MAYPTSLTDAKTDWANDTAVKDDHPSEHNLVATATEALEAKVGIDSSAVTTSHDYKLSGVTGSDVAVSKTGTETLTNKTLTSPTITGIASTGGSITGMTDIVVADGGTGVSSLTAFAPLFGGTTGTGAVQSGTVGTSGEVLTSNGAGVAPTFQAGGGLSEDLMVIATVELSAANIIAMNGTPITVLAAPGAGKVTVIDQMVWSFTYGTTQFTGGGDARIQYTGTTDKLTSFDMDANDIKGAVDYIEQSSQFVAGRLEALANTAIEITNATAAFADGDSTMKLFVRYRTLTL